MLLALIYAILYGTRLSALPVLLTSAASLPEMLASLRREGVVAAPVVQRSLCAGVPIPGFTRVGLSRDWRAVASFRDENLRQGLSALVPVTGLLGMPEKFLNPTIQLPSSTVVTVPTSF